VSTLSISWESAPSNLHGENHCRGSGQDPRVFRAAVKIPDASHDLSIGEPDEGATQRVVICKLDAKIEAIGKAHDVAHLDGLPLLAQSL
jgi:hypothetical protein